MSGFEPTIRTVIPNESDEPDVLAGAVLNSLTRPMYRRLSLNAAQSAALAFVSLGVVPMLLLPRWLRGFIAQQEQQLWHLAEWMRLQGGDADAAPLQQLSSRIRFNGPLGILTWLSTVVAIGAAVAFFVATPAHRFDIRALFAFGYHVPRSPEAILFTIALSAAAVIHCAHLAWHQQNVERYVQWFNKLATRQQVPEVPLSSIEIGLRPIWIAAGLAFAFGGAVWGLPLMLAAGAQRGYIRGASVQTRAQLAQRLREMLLARRPTMRVPKAISVTRICLRPNCRAAIPTVAKFCPRCGTRAARTMDVVA
jgi:hypothetical protein